LAKKLIVAPATGLSVSAARTVPLTVAVMGAAIADEAINRRVRIRAVKIDLIIKLLDAQFIMHNAQCIMDF
jgi:hypothetical protein